VEMGKRVYLFKNKLLEEEILNEAYELSLWILIYNSP